jgi:ATP-dependent Lon protease
MRGNVAVLIRLAGLYRLVKSTQATVERIERLKSKTPHMGEFHTTVLRFARAQAKLGLHFRFPPILLVGPPGAGKTHVAKTLATLCEVNSHVMQLGGSADTLRIKGLSKSWTGAGPGDVVRYIAHGSTANPIFVLDELEKSGKHSNAGSVADALLGLLEPETAKAWDDDWLGIPFRADHISIIATANSTDEISAPMLSRFLVYHVSEPDNEAKMAIVQGVFSDVITRAGLGGFVEGWLSDSSVDLVVERYGSVRDMRIACELAAFKAVDRVVVKKNGRLIKMSSVVPDDFSYTAKRACEARRIGF